MNVLPAYVSRDLVFERLPLIFPVGTPNRNYCTRELAASTVFTMLYIGAVEDADIYLGPVHVYRMTHEQAVLTGETDRIKYQQESVKPGFKPVGIRWYADNTREPIRDETLREGLVAVGAVLARPIPTTSSKPRYFLKKDFAALFSPQLTGEELSAEIIRWQQANLSRSALTRLALVGRSSKNASETVLITLPNKEARNISGGPSSVIAKEVIEVFAHQFLKQPAVVWLSTSDNKVEIKDDKIAASIGLKIESDKNLPDIILVDLAPAHPLIVFIEVVATDGAITARRQDALYKLTDEAGFDRRQVAFLTAYLDRQSSGFSKTIKELAWNSFAWFVSEPDKLVVFRDGPVYISTLVE